MKTQTRIACSFYFILMVCLTINVQAADLVVAPGGAGGAYSSINTAIASANSGDRIIVYPSSGGASYVEGTITISKSLQILSANEGAFYAVDGTISISPASAGMSLTIIGMKLVTGSISATAHAPAGTRCTVNLLYDSLGNGNIGFNYNNYNVTLANSYVVGYVNFNYGRAMGNVITTGNSYGIQVNTDATTSTDTLSIIGNKITYTYTGTANGGIHWNSSANYLMIMNNFIFGSYGGNNVGYGLYISLAKGGAGHNVVSNNTVYRGTGYWNSAIFVNLPVGYTGYFDVENNIGHIASYAIVLVNSGTAAVHYNIGSNSWSGFANDGTNRALTSAAFDADGKITNPACNAINGGTPDSAYADINLTRNDCGAYGGSYTLDNYFPNTSTDWSRVFYMTAPRRILVNGAINVRADGYDK